MKAFTKENIKVGDKIYNGLNDFSEVLKVTEKGYVTTLEIDRYTRKPYKTSNKITSKWCRDIIWDDKKKHWCDYNLHSDYSSKLKRMKNAQEQSDVLYSMMYR